LFVDTWLMSCRVLKRGMENFVLNTITLFARNNGFKTLKGEYQATAKNDIVKNHYKGLGFREKGAFWLLDIDTYQPKKSHIAKK
jgi:predicted enzyme involved in methoxymalonyl-ACP biosynthesis